MESRDILDSDSKPCTICGNMTWIYIINSQKKDNEKDYRCKTHYIELIDQFLKDRLDPSLHLFPKELRLNELPVHKAQLRYGGSIPTKYLLKSYQEDLIKEMERTQREIEQQQSFNPPSPFLNLLEKERLEKKLLHRLTLAEIKLLKK